VADFLKLYEDLATANRHIAKSKVRVNCQAELARKLDEGGHDTTEAQSLLRVLQESLDAVKAHREQIFREMARAAATNRPR
jgi:hypothetical protein